MQVKRANFLLNDKAETLANYINAFVGRKGRSKASACHFS